MSCPDWTLLTAWREERSGVEPEGWNEALAHFDGGCQFCRKAALKSDPTLVFRRLAQVPAVTMTEAQERAEVDSVRQAVAAMRAASRLESLETRRRGFAGWKRWSAAAALAMMAVTIPSDSRRSEQIRAGLVEEPMEVSMPAVRSAGNAQVLEGGVDRPGARVYQMDGEGLAVVMVFDESFDESFGG